LKCPAIRGLAEQTRGADAAGSVPKNRAWEFAARATVIFVAEVEKALCVLCVVVEA